MHAAGPLTQLAVALVLTGCTSLLGRNEILESAQGLPEAERAVLLVRGQWWLVYASDIEIIAVDGFRGQGWGTRRVEMTPGRHSILVETWVMLGGMDGRDRVQFDLEAQPGAEYQIRRINIGRSNAPRCTVILASRQGTVDKKTTSLPCHVRQSGAPES